MSPALTLIFGLTVFTLGAVAGYHSRRRVDRDDRTGISCSYCKEITRLKRSRTWPKVIMCEHCNRSIGGEDFFD